MTATIGDRALQSVGGGIVHGADLCDIAPANTGWEYEARSWCGATVRGVVIEAATVPPIAYCRRCVRIGLTKMPKNELTAFREAVENMVDSVHRNAADKGFWDAERNYGEVIALMHSELSEALEALRDGNLQSEKLPEGFSQLEEEMADVIIRVFDFAGGAGLDLAGAIVAKHEYNQGRPMMHGRDF